MTVQGPGMKTKVLLLLLLFLSPVLGHEFWLEPQEYRSAEVTKAIDVRIKVGMNFVGQAWKGKLDGLMELLQQHGQSRLSLLKDGKPSEPQFSLLPNGAGQYLLGLTNESSFIELEAKEFEDYVVSEGLEFVVAERAERGETALPGKELYRRCAKTLIQLGSGAAAESYSQKLGFPLEWIPQTNPYLVTASNSQTFQLIFEGEPLANAKVGVWHRSLGEVEKKEYRTNEEGLVTFPVQRRGSWLVNTVHMVRAEESEQADWQSYWGSFTFGY